VLLCLRHQSGRALSEAAVRLSVHGSSSKNSAFRARTMVTVNTNRKPRAVSRTHRLAWPSEVAKTSTRFTYDVSTSKTKRNRAMLVLNVNRNSQAAYHLPESSVSPNHRKRPNGHRRRHVVFPPSGRYHLVNVYSVYCICMIVDL